MTLASQNCPDRIGFDPPGEAFPFINTVANLYLAGHWLMRFNMTNKKKIISYDTESTGLAKPFEAILQFAARVYDEEGNILESVNWRARPPRHVLPSPGALMTTRTSISEALGATLSAYELANEMSQFFEANSPAIVTGYNILAYDEELVRHTMYGNLLAPYVTQTPGNERMDILLALKAACICDPTSYDMPTNTKGKRSFKLEHVAPHFGYPGHDAHDALGDVDATMFVARLVRSRSPEVWDALKRARSRSHVVELLRSGSPVAHLDWNHGADRPSTRVLLPICPDATIPGEWLCVDLDADVNRLLGMEPSDLKEAFKASGGVTAIRRVTANKMPLVFALDDPAVGGLDLTCDLAKVYALSSASGFAERLRQANALRRADYDPKVYVQDQLYSGGFFPANADKALVQAFHRAQPSAKQEIAQQFTDPRAKDLAALLIGSEWPEVLSPGDLSAYKDHLQGRFFADDVPWMTVPKALDEVSKLRSEAVGNACTLLEEYHDYLRKLAKQGVPVR